MSILIKGMDMPTSCADCELAEHYERYELEHYCPFMGWYADYEKCPLVPVPPHVWVSVSDRLPEDGEDVLCRLLDDNCEVCATVGCYRSTFKLWDLDAEWASSRHVTHWMPLPEMPED